MSKEGNVNKEETLRHLSLNNEDIKFMISHEESASKSLFDLLSSILSKALTLTFMLNGGAAVAVLAFLGTVMAWDAKYLYGMLWVLTALSLGVFLAVLTAALSYISQHYYCQQLETALSFLKLALQEGIETPRGKVLDVSRLPSNECANNLRERGYKWRKRAIYSEIGALLMFFVAMSFFVATFRCY